MTELFYPRKSSEGLLLDFIDTVRDNLHFSASVVHLLTIQISGQAAFDLKPALPCPSFSGSLDMDLTLRSKGIRRLYLQLRQAWRRCSLFAIWCESLWEHRVESGSSRVLRGKESHTSQERSSIWSTFRIFSERDKRSLGMPSALSVAVASLWLPGWCIEGKHWSAYKIFRNFIDLMIYTGHTLGSSVTSRARHKGNHFHKSLQGLRASDTATAVTIPALLRQPPDITIATCNPTVSGWWVSAESQCPFSRQT